MISTMLNDFVSIFFENQMKSIECSGIVFDIAFHPQTNIICAGTIEGQIDWYER